MASPPSNLPDFSLLLATIARALGDQHISFMRIGGQAVLLHGEPRLTEDRPRDLEDVAGVIRRKGDQLDWTYLEEWIRQFAAVPGREELPERLRALRSMER